MWRWPNAPLWSSGTVSRRCGCCAPCWRTLPSTCWTPRPGGRGTPPSWGTCCSHPGPCSPTSTRSGRACCRSGATSRSRPWRRARALRSPRSCWCCSTPTSAPSWPGKLGKLRAAPVGGWVGLGWILTRCDFSDCDQEGQHLLARSLPDYILSLPTGARHRVPTSVLKMVWVSFAVSATRKHRITHITTRGSRRPIDRCCSR